jgi:WD40 repeat protein
VIRVFKADTLEYVITLHRPPPLGKANIDSSSKKINISVTHDEKFADVIALVYNYNAEKLVALYSDKTFFIWDLKKSEKLYVYRYSTYHSGTINCMDLYTNNDDVLYIATCSDDKTVKFWNIKLEDFTGVNTTRGKFYLILEPRKLNHIAYSKLLRRIFYFGKTFEHFKFNLSEMTEKNRDDDIHLDLGKINLNVEEEEIVYVKFSPDERYLLCGDNFGNIYIYDLNTFQQVNNACVHNSQITCIDIIKQESLCYLATSSQDGLIHVIDVSRGFDKDFETYERSTLSDHDGPVFSVLFYEDIYKKIRLVTCSKDNVLVYLINNSNDVSLIHKINEDGLETYCLALNRNLIQVVSGHNGKITQWKSVDFTFDMIFKTLKGNKNLDNFRIAIDATGTIMAVSCSDKVIRIRSTTDGSLLTKIPVAESISSLYFGINNSYLIASSVEGYIYFYHLDITSYINSSSTQITNTQINNKLKFFEKLIQNDTNFSQMEKAQYLIDKIKKGEDLDFRVLDSKYELETRIREDKFETKNTEIINLKEENTPLSEEEEDTTQRLYMTKSKLFEKNLKEVSNNDMFKKSMLAQSRTSFTDTYFKKKEFGVPKDDKVFKRAQVDVKNIYLDEDSTKNASEVKVKDEKKQAEHNLMLEEIRNIQQMDKEIDKIREVRTEKKNDIVKPIKEDVERSEIIEHINSMLDDQDYGEVQEVKKKKDDHNSLENFHDNYKENFDEATDNKDTQDNIYTREVKEVKDTIDQVEEVKVNNFYSISPTEQERKVQPNIKPEDEFAVNQLKELISNTNKYVDDIGNKYINEVNRKKETETPRGEDDYDYYADDNIQLTLSNKEESREQSEARLQNIPKVEKVGLFDITEDIKEDINETTTHNDLTSRFDVSDTIMKKDRVFDIEKLGTTNILVDVSKDTFTIPTMNEFFKRNRFIDLIRRNTSEFSIIAPNKPKKTIKQVIETIRADLEGLSTNELKETKE